MNNTYTPRLPFRTLKPYLLLMAIGLGLALAGYWLQFSVRATSAVDPYLFKDIEVSIGSSYPHQFTKFDDKVFFEASDSIHGSELWVSDGTITGTMLFMDFLPGNQGSYPSHSSFAIAKDTLFFSPQAVNGDWVLWKSDGTITGTIQIPGTKTTCELYKECTDLISMNNIIYFYGGDSEHGYELWRTDGTVTGTMMIKDIRPGPESSMMIQLANFNDTLYFFADDGIHGHELWKSDGTTDGTQLVKDINPGTAPCTLGVFGNPILMIGNTLFVSADDGVHGIELWKSDGTITNTNLVKDIYPGNSSSLPVHLTIYDGELFFYANDGIHGEELWKSDGSVDGTTLLKDMWPGSQGNIGHCYPCTLGIIYQGYLYYEAGDAYSLQLWRTDGTENGTKYVMELDGSGSSRNHRLTSLNNLLYIYRYVAGQNGIWISDGSGSPTLSVTDAHPYWYIRKPNSTNFVNNNYFFNASSSNYGQELWAIPVTTQSEMELSLVSQNILKSGDPITYTIAFSNKGNTDVANVILTNTLSTALNDIQYVSSGASITLTSTSPYIWVVSDLAPGDGGVITITAVISTSLDSGDIITNSAQISAEASDGIFLRNRRAKQGTILNIYKTYLPLVLKP